MRKISFATTTMMAAFSFAVGCSSSHEASPADTKVETEVDNYELQLNPNHHPSEATEASLLPPLAFPVPRPEGTIAWKPCPKPIYPDAECGTVTVPVDWSKPDGETTSKAVHRLKATHAKRRLGTLWFASGDTGLWFDKKPGEEHAPSTRLREHFDIVGFDQRGVYDGEPIACDPQLTKELGELYGRRPRSPIEHDDWTKKARAFGEDCLRRYGQLADLQDDLTEARDIDAIRGALGEAKLHVYARSNYPTQLTMAYAEMFPHRMHALVLDSVEDHSASTATLMTRSAQAVDSSFIQFAEWARRTPGSALYGQEVQPLWDRLYANAKAGKLIDPNSGQPMATSALLLEASSPLFRQPHNHRWGELAQRLVDLDAGRRTPGWDPQPSSDDDFSWVAPTLTGVCANWDYTDVADFAELDRAYRAADARAPHLHEAWDGEMPWPSACHAWPMAVRNPQHPLSITGGPTVLIANSRYDIKAAYANAVAVHRQIPGAALLTYEGVGHGTYDRSPCIRHRIESYLMTGHTPAPGASCPAIWPAAQESDEPR